MASFNQQNFYKIKKGFYSLVYYIKIRCSSFFRAFESLYFSQILSFYPRINGSDLVPVPSTICVSDVR